MKAGSRFADQRLTPQQNKAAEMALNGCCIPEIAEELDVSDTQVSVLLHNARKRGVSVRAPRQGSRALWPPARVLSLRQKGLTYSEIMERTGLSRSSVKVLLWKARSAHGLALKAMPRNDPEMVERWIQMARDGHSCAAIARAHGKTRSAISGAIYRLRQKGANR